jgi:hypothetical protein
MHAVSNDSQTIHNGDVTEGSPEGESVAAGVAPLPQKTWNQGLMRTTSPTLGIVEKRVT